MTALEAATVGLVLALFLIAWVWVLLILPAWLLWLLAGAVVGAGVTSAAFVSAFARGYRR